MTPNAFSIAAWLSRAHRNGSLATLLKPDLTPPERTIAQIEGWILGVPGLIRVGGERNGSGYFGSVLILLSQKIAFKPSEGALAWRYAPTCGLKERAQ